MEPKMVTREDALQAAYNAASESADPAQTYLAIAEHIAKYAPILGDDHDA